MTFPVLALSTLDIILIPLALAIIFGPPLATVIAYCFLWDNKFRMHLSTAVILLLLTGILLGLNLSKHHGVYRGGGDVESPETYYGFPARAYQILDSSATTPDIDDSFEKLPSGEYLVHDDIIPIFAAVLWNVFVALAVLSWVWFFCERRIRHSGRPN